MNRFLLPAAGALAVVTVLAAAALAAGVIGGAGSSTPSSPLSSALPPSAALPSASLSSMPPVAAATSPVSPSQARSPAPSPTPSPSPRPTPSPSPSPSPRPVRAPLTGRLVSPEAAERHPIAVMIDDIRAARPQSGFAAASVVWQAPAEGGIPRYMLVFAEEIPGSVGPVRSARHYYIAWAAEWRAVYVHVGGSPLALQTLRESGRGQLVYNADEFRYGRTYLWRIKERFSPHNVYSDGEHLRQLAALVGATDSPMKPAWRFARDLPHVQRPVGGRIELVYPANRIGYDYERDTNTYLRSVSGETEQLDAGTGQRVAPKNVVIMLVHFSPLGGSPNKHRLEAQLVGTGPAWIATNGRTIEGTWRKKSLTEPTRFYDASGKPVTLTVGQTFVQVMPYGSTITIKDGKVRVAKGLLRGPSRPLAI